MSIAERGALYGLEVLEATNPEIRGSVREALLGTDTARDLQVTGEEVIGDEVGQIPS